MSKKRIKEKYELYLEAVRTLGYGAERIFAENTAKILAENVDRKTKEFYATTTWNYLLERQKILIYDYEREKQAQTKIATWRENIGQLEKSVRETPQNALAQQLKLKTEIAFLEGRIAEHQELMCFSHSWLEHMTKENVAISQLKEYLNTLRETQHLRLSEKYR
jgi:hypothetical protein